ncbi:hypothetical protein QFC22_000972 [Naganishia vaughanmartiniae]|uniref:Uncharacterized protein n=1 Tax=Naganishia vaughanmartiniae TaxID=1424756 RepID=A0ACC2XKN7_9TREE|nr:hypothetical protein QFC22_000972 [Naganishia vaughanmartiniae]
MVYQSFASPLPSPPADGHALPFLPAKRLDSIRKAYASPLTPVRSQGSWFVSGADSDADSEGSDDSQGTGRRSSDGRLQSIPTIVLSEYHVIGIYDESKSTNSLGPASAPPQSPVSQFLLSEEDIQSSLNANLRRERLVGFGSRLTGLGEKMAMMNIDSTSFNQHRITMDSPTRSRSVSPPPVSVAPPQRIQLQQGRNRTTMPNGSPIKDLRRASTESIRPLTYTSAAFDNIHSSSSHDTPTPKVVSPSVVKMHSAHSATRSSTPREPFNLPSRHPMGKAIKRPALVRADKSIDLQRVGRKVGRFDAIPQESYQTNWSSFDESSQEPSWMATAGQNFRRNSNSDILPTPVTAPKPAAFFDCAHDSATEDDHTSSITQFRAFPKPTFTWTPTGLTRKVFKPYLFLLVPLVLMFLHVYYSAVNQEFLRAGNAMVFGQPVVHSGVWSSRDLMLIDDHFDGLSHHPADGSRWYAESPESTEKKKDTTTESSHAGHNGHVTGGRRIRWLRRA